MKEFVKSVDWKMFVRYELYCIGILVFLYLASPNKFPHNFYAVILIALMWSVMMLLSAHSRYMMRNAKPKVNNDFDIEVTIRKSDGTYTQEKIVGTKKKKK